MGETFYSVLGVDPDADTETIKRAYRELVKDHHPDVSDADDAALTFQRLTEARDVLVDPDSRGQYDSLGHATYVRRHLDSNAWSVADAADAGQSRSTSASSSSTGSSDSGRSGGGSDSSTGEDHRRRRENAENYRRYRSSYEPNEGRADGNPFGDRSGRTTWADDGDVDWGDAADEGEDAATASSAGSTGADQARADAWQTAHAAGASAAVNRPGTATTEPGPGIDGLGDGLRRVGPWIAFHVVFLASAFITVWLLMSMQPSVPTLLISVVVLGCTVFFSILHVISRIYS